MYILFKKNLKCTKSVKIALIIPFFFLKKLPISSNIYIYIYICINYFIYFQRRKKKIFFDSTSSHDIINIYLDSYHSKKYFNK